MTKRSHDVRRKLNRVHRKRGTKPPKPKNEFWGGCVGGCPHYKWCNAHRRERFPCENIKEDT